MVANRLGEDSGIRVHLLARTSMYIIAEIEAPYINIIINVYIYICVNARGHVYDTSLGFVKAAADVAARRADVSRGFVPATEERLQKIYRQ